MTPDTDLASAREATGRLLAHLDDLTAQDLRTPSLLPGWTRAHVVAHLAGNARSHVRMLEGCLAGDVRTQYAGGAGERAEAIDALAAHPAAALAAHREACADLERCWSTMIDDHWTRPLHWLDDAEPSPAWTEPRSRRRECEVHGVDLGAGYGPWPQSFTAGLLDELAARDDLPPLVLLTPDGARRGDGGRVVRGTPWSLALWLSGRSAGDDLDAGGPLPALPPWR